MAGVENRVRQYDPSAPPASTGPGECPESRNRVGTRESAGQQGHSIFFRPTVRDPCGEHGGSTQGPLRRAACHQLGGNPLPAALSIHQGQRSPPAVRSQPSPSIKAPVARLSQPCGRTLLVFVHAVEIVVSRRLARGSCPGVGPVRTTTDCASRSTAEQGPGRRRDDAIEATRLAQHPVHWRKEWVRRDEVAHGLNTSLGMSRTQGRAKPTATSPEQGVLIE
jgi:hypothetical protein